MIQGVVPTITLWVIVCSAWASFLFIMATKWWRHVTTILLTVYVGTTALWWTIILYGTYHHPTPGGKLQVAQAILFLAMALGYLSLALTQAYARARDVKQGKEVHQ